MKKLIFTYMLIGMLTACQGSNKTFADVAATNLSESKYEEAIENYDAAIQEALNTTEHKMLAELYFNRAEAKYFLALGFLPNDQNLYDSLTDYSKAIELYPEDAFYYRGRGSVLVALGAYDSAFSDFETMSNIEGSDIFWSMVRTGGLHRLLGDYDQAMTAFNKVSEKWEHAMPVNYHKALTYNRFGEYQDAIASIQTGLLAQDDYPYAYLEMACSKAMLKRYDEALEDFRQGTRLISKVRSTSTEHLPRFRHEQKLHARNEQYLENLTLGVTQLTPEITKSLCYGSWWHMHYEAKREKSSLLPHQ